MNEKGDKPYENGVGVFLVQRTKGIPKTNFYSRTLTWERRLNKVYHYDGNDPRVKEEWTEMTRGIVLVNYTLYE